MEEALASFADELPALLARFAALLQGGIDPVTALRQHLAAGSVAGTLN